MNARITDVFDSETKAKFKKRLRVRRRSHLLSCGRVLDLADQGCDRLRRRTWLAFCIDIGPVVHGDLTSALKD